MDLGSVHRRRLTKGDKLFMTKQDKENLKNKQLTDSLLISCLATCESVISKKAYLEKKWNGYNVVFDQTAGDMYRQERLEWMKYREKLRSLLLPVYSMKMIIQMTKSCKDKASQKEVIQVIHLIETNDYELV